MKKNKTVIDNTPSELARSLGLSFSDAVEWEVRHSVTQKIISTLAKNPLTVTELAKESGTSRARITKILKADTFGISLDVLFRVLGAVGQTVKLNYRNAS